MYRVFEDADTDALARAQGLSFGFPPDDATKWWDLAGRENLRVWDDDGVRGGLVDIPMGMFFGGRSVPLHGVAGVAIAPASRGRGVGHAMMAAYLQDLAARRVPLSALYASTRGLYRSVGYGIGGNRYLATFDTEILRSIGDRKGAWRPIEDADWTVLEQTYARRAAVYPTLLDRGPYIWQRVQKHRGSPNTGWLLEDDDGLRAWLVVRQKHVGEWLHLEVVDRWASDPAALRRLAGLLSTFGSMARTLEVPCAGVDPLLDLVPEFRTTVTLHEPWMLRVVDVRDALEKRGWPSDLTTTLQLEVSDPLIRDNNGRFTVRIAEGAARVQAGSDGSVRVSVMGLAGLYTGHASPWDLRLRGELDATDGAMASIAAAFASPSPRLTDFF